MGSARRDGNSEGRLKQIIINGDHLKLKNKQAVPMNMGPSPMTSFDLGKGIKSAMNIRKISNNHFTFVDKEEKDSIMGEGVSSMMDVDGPMQNSPQDVDKGGTGNGETQLVDPGPQCVAQGIMPMQTSGT